MIFYFLARNKATGVIHNFEFEDKNHSRNPRHTVKDIEATIMKKFKLSSKEKLKLFKKDASQNLSDLLQPVENVSGT